MKFGRFTNFIKQLSNCLKRNKKLDRYIIDIIHQNLFKIILNTLYLKYVGLYILLPRMLFRLKLEIKKKKKLTRDDKV